MNTVPEQVDDFFSRLRKLGRDICFTGGQPTQPRIDGDIAILVTPSRKEPGCADHRISVCAGLPPPEEVEGLVCVLIRDDTRELVMRGITNRRGQIYLPGLELIPYRLRVDFRASFAIPSTATAHVIACLRGETLPLPENENSILLPLETPGGMFRATLRKTTTKRPALALTVSLAPEVAGDDLLSLDISDGHRQTLAKGLVGLKSVVEGRKEREIDLGLLRPHKNLKVSPPPSSENLLLTLESIPLEEVIGKSNPAAAQVVPALLGALADEYGSLRHSAAVALLRISPQTTLTVPALLETLLAGDHLSRRELRLEAFARIGSETVPALIEVLTHEDPWLRQNAAIALVKILVQTSLAVPSLPGALRWYDPNHMRKWVTEALSRISPEAVPALVAVMEERDAFLWYRVKEALRWTGPSGAGAEAGPEESLVRTEPAATASLPTLVKALGGEDAFQRQSAEVALGRIGAPAVPALVEALEGKDDFPRHRAAEALGRIGSAAAAAVPALIQALGDREPLLRYRAAEALARMGPTAATAVPALIQALAVKDAILAPPAAEALGRIGQPAVPALAQALEDSDAWVRSRAATALGRIGPAAVSVLIRAVEDTDADVRRIAIAGL
jgi:HEAT repeat protein